MDPSGARATTFTVGFQEDNLKLFISTPAAHIKSVPFASKPCDIYLPYIYSTMNLLKT